MNQKFKIIRQILVALVLIVAVAGLSSCEKYSFAPPTINPLDTIYFQADIQPIFTANCITCHGALRAPDLRNGKSYKSLTEGGYVTLPGESSTLYVMMTSSDHIPRSTDGDKLKVLAWINQGAMNN
jgi:hypothetical protein